MKRMKLTTAGRVVIFVIVLALLAGIGGFGYNYYKQTTSPSVRALSLAARPRSPRQSPPPARRAPLIP